MTIGSDTFTANAASQFLVAPGQILTPGGQLTVDGTTVSLAPSASEVIIDGVTHSLSSVITPPPVVNIGGTLYEANSGSTYEVGGEPLTPGGVITVSGTTISLASDASTVVVNGVAQTAMPIATAAGAQLPLLTVGGHTYTAGTGSAYIIDGQTLVPGSAITLSGGTTLSLPATPSDLVFDGATSTISSQPTITAPPILTIDGSLITAAPGTGTSYLVSGQLLTPGGKVTFSGPNGLETISLNPSGNVLVDAVSGATTTSSIPIPGSYNYGVQGAAAPILTIGNDTFTALPGRGPSYLINGDTLTPGGVLTETIDGSTFIVSLSPSATVLVVREEGPDGRVTATMTETLFPATLSGAGRGTETLTTGTGASGAAQSTASPSTTGGIGNDAGLQNTASDSRVGGLVLAAALGVLGMAILL